MDRVHGANRVDTVARMAPRLDSEQIEVLRAWGAGLAEDPREEVRAAGKAITLLVDEIDRLNIDLWNLRAPARPESVFSEDQLETDAAAASPPDEAAAQPEPVGIEQPTLGNALRERLRRRRRDQGGGPARLSGGPGAPESRA